MEEITNLTSSVADYIKKNGDENFAKGIEQFLNDDKNPDKSNVFDYLDEFNEENLKTKQDREIYNVLKLLKENKTNEKGNIDFKALTDFITNKLKEEDDEASNNPVNTNNTEESDPEFLKQFFSTKDEVQNTQGNIPDKNELKISHDDDEIQKPNKISEEKPKAKTDVEIAKEEEEALLESQKPKEMPKYLKKALKKEENTTRNDSKSWLDWMFTNNKILGYDDKNDLPGTISANTLTNQAFVGIVGRFFGIGLGALLTLINPFLGIALIAYAALPDSVNKGVKSMIADKTFGLIPVDKIPTITNALEKRATNAENILDKKFKLAQELKEHAKKREDEEKQKEAKKREESKMKESMNDNASKKPKNVNPTPSPTSPAIPTMTSPAIPATTSPAIPDTTGGPLSKLETDLPTAQQTTQKNFLNKPNSNVTLPSAHRNGI